jgi:hypothetical protein
MFSIPELWLPILLSAVAVFLASSVIHMVLPAWHRNDSLRLPAEDRVADALRGTPPGEYRMPYGATTAEMKTPAFEEKLARGPIALIGVYREFAFGKALIYWFVYALVASWFAGHTAHRALPAGASDYLVFHTTAMTAFAAYGVGLAQASIWGPRPWTTTFKGMLDALVYSLVTGAVFAWRWPM